MDLETLSRSLPVLLVNRKTQAWFIVKYHNVRYAMLFRDQFALRQYAAKQGPNFLYATDYKPLFEDNIVHFLDGLRRFQKSTYPIGLMYIQLKAGELKYENLSHLVEAKS